VKSLSVAACVLVACSSRPLEPSTAGGGTNGNSAGAGAVAEAGAVAQAGAVAEAGSGGGKFADSCSAARAQLLGAIDTVSSGVVKLVSEASGVETLYVDATVGGQDGVTTHPWTFISLGSASKVAVTDLTSVHSLAWDLAFKRAQIYTNGGEGGPGEGASVFLDKDFAQVTSADLTGAGFATETFFAGDCNPIVDLTGAASTSFSSWYDYDQQSHVLSPVPGTWLVRSATGKFFKLRFDSYYATPNGGMGSVSGAYLLEIGAL